MTGQQPADWRAAFESLVQRRTRKAAEARIETLSTIFDRREDEGIRGIGNAWTRMHYGGDFGLFPQPEGGTAMSLVFVQSRDGNTGASDPGILGGGATDKHFIYEGLSRVAADAVLTTSGTIDRNAFYSIWHPELVKLRASLGLPRHPAQIVVSKRGEFDFNAPLFNVPDVPLFLVAGDEGIARHALALRARPWIRLIPLVGYDLRPAIDYLRTQAGIQRISPVGGSFTASHLVDQGLVQDLYLTTTARDAGEPGTPWYVGTGSPRLKVVTQKQWIDDGSAIRFEHVLIGRPLAS